MKLGGRAGRAAAIAGRPVTPAEVDLKVLLVIDHLGPGGSQRQIVNLATGLAVRGHSVTIFTYHPDDHYSAALAEHRIERISVPKRSRFDPAVVGRLRRVIRDGRHDVCCSFLFTPNTYLLAATLLGGAHKVIVSERGSEVIVPRWYKLVTRRLLYRRAHAVVVNSRHHLDLLQRRHPSLADRLHYIPNGVVLDAFTTAKRQGPSGELRLLGVGKVSDLKNPRVLIEALRILGRYPDMRMRVRWLGQLHDEYGGSDYYRGCVELLERYELADRWSWEGIVSDVPGYYPDTDVMVHPSHAEGFPNAICEALASATPVLASRVYDHPAIIEDGVQGYLFDPDDPAELASKLRQFFASPVSERLEMAARARATAESRFSNPVMVDRFEALFEKTV